MIASSRLLFRDCGAVEPILENAGYFSATESVCALHLEAVIENSHCHSLGNLTVFRNWKLGRDLMFFKSLSCLLIFLVWSFLAEASREFVEVSTEAVSEKASMAGAKQEIFQLASDNISEKYIRQIIGDSKFEKNRDIIKNKVMSNSAKYILYIKGGQAERTASGIRMNVTMKLALKSLRQLLLNQGLLYEIEGPPKVLSLMSIENRVDGSSFSWWVDEGGEDNLILRGLFYDFQRSLRTKLTPKGFFNINAGKASARNSLPQTLRSVDAPTEDLLMIGDFLKAQIVVLGRIQIKKSAKRPDVFEIHFRGAALYTSNGRVVGEVIRVFETPAGNFNQVVRSKGKEIFPSVAKDLTVQLYEAWKSGTFGSSLLRLAFSGQFNFGQVSLLKYQLLNSVSELKSLKERKFTPSGVVFEVDSGSSAQKLVERIQAAKFEGFSVSVEDWSSDQLKLAISFR
jgi:exosome complex RNA-binding protein Csl4